MKPILNHSARAGAAVLVVCIGMLGLLGTSALAGGDGGLRPHAKGQYDASTNTYTVVAGDDLIDIAERFGTTVGELETLNTLTSDEILAGQTLVVDAIVETTVGTDAAAQTDPLPSWNDGPAKQAILNFVQTTTDQSSPEFVPPAERIATFDQDGTLWVEHPVYSFVVYALERVPDLVKAKPELAKVAPFSTVLEVLKGDHAALAKLTLPDLEKVLAATYTGRSVDAFTAQATQWITHAKDSRWKRLYTELVYQPMQEVLKYLRANGYQTHIVTGGGQDFVRVYSSRVYGIPPEQVVGTAGVLKYEYDKDGKPFLFKEPKLLLNDNDAGKAKGIHLMIGRRPYAAFGNSTGDRQMLEYTKAGDGARLSMILLHDDAKREYAYGPAQGLPNTKVGTFTQALYDEAKKQGWIVISMKDDWKRIFRFAE